MKLLNMILIVIAILTVSCSEQTTNPAELNKNFETFDFKIDLEKNNYEIQSNLKQSKYYNRTYSQANCNIPLNVIEHFTKSLTKDYNNIKGLTFILNKKDSIYNISNVLGFSLYYISSNKLYHTFYLNEDNTFKEKNFYNVEVKGFSPHTLEILFQSIGSKIDYNKIVAVNMFSDIINLHQEQNVHLLPLKVAIKNKILLKNRLKVANIKFLGIDPGNGGGNDGCGPCEGCEYGLPDDICVADSPISYYGCRPSSPWDCPGQDECEMIENNNDSSYANTAFNMVLQYSFRDDFLQSTVYGRSLTTYYYALNHYIRDSITLDLAYETAEVLIDFNQVMMKLLNPSQYLNDTLIPSALKTDLLNLLAQYRLLNTDSTYIAMIDDVIDDVNNLSSLSISQFLTYIYYN